MTRFDESEECKFCNLPCGLNFFHVFSECKNTKEMRKKYFGYGLLEQRVSVQFAEH